MLQHILLPLILILPFATCIFSKIKNQTCANDLHILVPIIFLILLTGLFTFDETARQLLFLQSSGIFSFGFIIDASAAKTLYLLGFVWLIITIYSNGYLKFTSEENPYLFKNLMALIIAFLHLTIVAKNLITLLFFANLLFLTAHIFATNFLYEKEAKIAKILTYLIYFQSFLLFLATVATYKFIHIIDFNISEDAFNSINTSSQITILLLYLVALFLVFIIPSYAFCRNIILDSFKIYLFFILGLGVFSFYILMKVVVSFFHLSQFSSLITLLGFINIEVIVVFLLLIPAILIFLSQDFNESVLLLLFGQIIFSIFSSLIFLNYYPDKPYLPFLSFILSQTLLFLTLSNLSIYKSRAQNNDSKGLFFQLKITLTLMFFAFLNLYGIVPALGMYEKFLILRTIFQEGLVLSGIIFMLNLLILTVFVIKFLMPAIQTTQIKPTEGDIELARTIDQDSYLMLTTLVLALVIFILPIILWFNLNLLSV